MDLRSPPWLFSGSRTGGERAAAIYTVIQILKANGVDPEAYIADVIARIADDWSASRWNELRRRNWVGRDVSPDRASRVTCGPHAAFTPDH